MIDRPEPSMDTEEGTSLIVIPETSAPAEAPPAAEDGTDSEQNIPMGPPQQYLDVARGFAQDITAPGPEWRARVSRWSTPQLAQSYATTDINRVQSGKLTDLTEQATGSSVVDFVATYDTGLRLGIRAEYSAGMWKISTCQPMETAY